jgi:nucleoid DNA-binding protein
MDVLYIEIINVILIKECYSSLLIRCFRPTFAFKYYIERMKTKEFISALASATGHRIGDTGQLLETVATLMGDHFSKGDSVQIAGLGTFEVRKKMERIIVNPGTGQRMLVPPKLVLAFKPYLALKEQITKTE